MRIAYIENGTSADHIFKNPIRFIDDERPYPHTLPLAIPPFHTYPEGAYNK